MVFFNLKRVSLPIVMSTSTTTSNNDFNFLKTKTFLLILLLFTWSINDTTIQHRDERCKKLITLTKTNNTKMHRHVSKNNPFTITSHLRFLRNTTLWLPFWFYCLLFYNIFYFFWNHKNVSDKFDGVIYRWPTMFHFTYPTDIFFILNYT